MSETFQPEIGQALFGNAFGDYDAGEIGEACLKHALDEIARVFWNREQSEWDRHEDPRIPGIAFRPYYWGDCDCGFDALEAEHHDEHAASCYQRAYALLPLGEDHSIAARALCETRGIPWNNGYGSAVHCDCGYRERWAAWYAANGHRPTCATELPNLAFGGVEIRWYKHPGRSVTVNRQMDGNAWRSWLNAIVAQVRRADVQFCSE